MPPYGPDVMRFHEGGPGIANGLLLVLFLTLLVALGAWLVAGVLRPRGRFAHHEHASQVAGWTPGSRSTDALHILDERFARGEIDVDDYRTRRDLLTSSMP